MFLMGKCFLGQFRIRKWNSLDNVTSLKYRYANSTNRHYFHFAFIPARATAVRCKEIWNHGEIQKKTYFQGIGIWETRSYLQRSPKKLLINWVSATLGILCIAPELGKKKFLHDKPTYGNWENIKYFNGHIFFVILLLSNLLKL